MSRRRRRRQFGWPSAEHEPVAVDALVEAGKLLASAQSAHARGDCQTAIAHWAYTKEEITKAAQHIASFFPRHGPPTGDPQLRDPTVNKQVLDLMQEARELQENLMRTCVRRGPGDAPRPSGPPQLQVVRGYG